MANKIKDFPSKEGQTPNGVPEPKSELQMRAENEMAMLQRTAEYKQMQSQMKPKIGTEQIRKASETLRKYKEGKARLEQKIIANEEFWKLRQWNYMNDDYFVVPVGKLKEKNKPFGSDPTTQKLIDIPQEMFDVNSIAYHQRYRVLLLSSNSAGPNDNDIEDYLNSYLPADAKYKVRLRPIMRSIEIEKIRNAQEARSVTISLNLGRPLNDFLGGQVHKEKSVQGCIKDLMELSKTTLDSNTFSLTLGLGRKRNATLDIGALVDLLDSINLNADCIHEISVNYRNGPDQKIDIAKLKVNQKVKVTADA